MPFPYDRYPWLNFQELNLAYFIEHFREIFEQWDQLLQDQEAWKEATEADLAAWKSDTLDALAAWKSQTETDIACWETTTLAALNAWQTAAETAFEVIRVQAAASATEAGNYATAAQNAKTAAETAQAAAEAAAASISSSAAAIAGNADNIENLRFSIGVPAPFSIGAAWTQGQAVDRRDGGNLTAASYSSYKRTDFLQLPTGAEGIVYLRTCTTLTSIPNVGIAFYSSDSIDNFISGVAGAFNAPSGVTSRWHYEPIPEGATHVRFTYWADSVISEDQFGAWDAAVFYRSGIASEMIGMDLAKALPLYETLIADAAIINYIVDSNGQLSGRITGGVPVRTSYELAATGYKAISILAPVGAQAAFITFCTGSVQGYTDGAKVPLCLGTAPRYAITQNQWQTFMIPWDCTHMLIWRTYGSTDFRSPDGFLYTDASLPISYTDSVAKSYTPGGVTAVIVGASLEAGQTHEVPNDNTPADPAKAYLTVALLNNGVKPTNKSVGGIGFIVQKNGVNGVSIVAGTDFSAFDSAYICLGYNDWENGSAALGDPTTSTAADDPMTVCSSVKYCIETIYASNPYIKLFIKPMGGPGGVKAGGYTQAQLEEALAAICQIYHIERMASPWVLEDQNAPGSNFGTLYPDGKHPNQKGMAVMAVDMTGKITFK